ncbi:MAG TPA: hypothetical protein DCZ91_06505 [Lachnospiraceae bacterium]|nr:hypothetical protein [Lachnospiraceae bacterium]
MTLCDMMGIPLADHVIVGGDSGQYFSFLNNGLMPDVHKKVYTDCGSLQFTSADRERDREKNGQGEVYWSSKITEPSKKRKESEKQASSDAENSNRKKAPAPAAAERSTRHGKR